MPAPAAPPAAPKAPAPAAIAPAPPTPSPSPSPSPAPKPPTPDPSPAPPAPAPGSKDDMFAQLDSQLGRTPEAPKPPEPKPGEPAAKPAAPAAGNRPVLKEPKQLRAELDRVTSELEANNTKMAELERKYAAAEERGKNTDGLMKQIETLRGQMDEKEAKLRAAEFQESEAFKNTHEKPWNAASSRAYNALEGTTWVDEQGQTHTNSFEDFTRLFQLKEVSAEREAPAMFGPEGAKVAMRYYYELKNLEANRQSALKEERAQWQSKREAQAAQEAEQSETITRLQDKVNKDLADSIPDYFDAPDADKEIIEVRNKGYQIFDTKPKTLQELLLKQAHIRHKVAAYGPLKLQLNRERAKNAQLEAELSKFTTAGDPPNPQHKPGGDPSAAPQKDWATGLKEVMSSVGAK